MDRSSALGATPRGNPASPLPTEASNAGKPRFKSSPNDQKSIDKPT
jgi:hypothetical protein